MTFLRIPFLSAVLSILSVWVLALSGCPDTETLPTVECDAGYAFDDPPVRDGGTPVCTVCRDGYDREDLADGGFVCTPATDSGMDAGDAGDTGPDADTGLDAGPDADTGVDAGPCGMECTGTTPLCNPTTGLCVACVLDEHCTDPAQAKCGADGMCTACDDSLQCGGITGTEVCATTGDNAGECVECAVGEVGACGGNPCNPVSNACSAYGDGVVGTCEACDSDANCSAAEHYCVPMEYPMGTARATGYCLHNGAGGCGQPLSIGLTGRTSLSGVEGVNYCGLNEMLTTCEAVTALDDNQMCPGGMDSECPEGGICRTLTPATPVTNRCTYLCSGASECIDPPTAGNTCAEGTGGAEYCGG